MAVLAVMCVGMFLVLLDVTVVNVALPSIASGLGADSAATPWVVDAYAVAIACLLLAGGTVGDRIGHRRVVLAGFALVEPASGYQALLPALLGIGIGAGLFTAPVVTAAMSAVPVERSGLASGINNTARQTGTALGVAVFGAVAGGTATPGAFVHGVHVLAGLGAAGLARRGVAGRVVGQAIVTDVGIRLIVIPAARRGDRPDTASLDTWQSIVRVHLGFGLRSRLFFGLGLLVGLLFGL